MKNEIDTTTLEPKITPKSHQSANYIWGTTCPTPQTQFITANFTREQYLNAEGLIRSIAELTQISLDIMDVLGKTREQVQITFLEKLSHRNRRAGVRTLVQKYGHESAARIVKNHSGRNIR